MASFRAWIKASRLRTLPLALASIAMGGFVAATHPDFKLDVAIMAAVTTLLLQILSNFSNDYGDFVGGSDNEKRIGPKRTVQSGEVGKSEMQIAMLVFALLSLAAGVYMIFWLADISMIGKIGLLIAGLASIYAAIRYTVGEKPYGYRGLGDLNVFIFFGLAAVLGTYYLATNSLNGAVFLPAIAIGMLSTAVLNLNNMRDHVNDELTGKHTLVVKMGYHKALKYHAFLVLAPFVLMTVFLFIRNAPLLHYGFLILLPLFVHDLVSIFKIEGKAALDPFLRKLALKTLLFTIVSGLLINM